MKHSNYATFTVPRYATEARLSPVDVDQLADADDASLEALRAELELLEGPEGIERAFDRIEVGVPHVREMAGSPTVGSLALMLDFPPAPLAEVIAGEAIAGYGLHDFELSHPLVKVEGGARERRFVRMQYAKTCDVYFEGGDIALNVCADGRDLTCRCGDAYDHLLRSSGLREIRVTTGDLREFETFDCLVRRIAKLLGRPAVDSPDVRAARRTTHQRLFSGESSWATPQVVPGDVMGGAAGGGGLASSGIGILPRRGEPVAASA